MAKLALPGLFSPKHWSRSLVTAFAFWVLALVVVQVVAMWQAEHPDPYREAGRMSFGDWFFYPVERNAEQRLPVFLDRLRFAGGMPGGGIWVAGGGELQYYAAPDADPVHVSLIEKGARRLRAVAFAPDGKNGWAGGTKIFRTRDGGETWEIANDLLQLESDPAALRDNPVALICPSPSGGPPAVVLEDGRALGADESLLRGPIVSGACLNDGVLLIDDTSIYVLRGDLSLKSVNSEFAGLGLSGLYFSPDERLGWIATEQGTLLRSAIDDVDSWRPYGSVDGGTPSAIHFHDDGRRGWLATDEGRVLYTDNSGETWSVQWEHPRQFWTGIHFDADGRGGWLFGGRTLMGTLDGGRTWLERSRRVSLGFEVTANGEALWLRTAEGLRVSRDGGKSWPRFPEAGLGGRIVALDFELESKRGWLATDQGGLFISNNSGLTWEPIPTRGADLGRVTGIFGAGRRVHVLAWPRRSRFARMNRFDTLLGLDSVEAPGRAWYYYLGGSPNGGTLLTSGRTFGSSVIYRSLDGLRWRPVYQTPGIIADFQVLDSLRAAMLEHRYEDETNAAIQAVLRLSDDGGRTWKQVEGGIATRSFRVCFASTDQGYLAGMDDSGRVVMQITRNAGATWRPVTLESREQVSYLKCSIDGRRAWTVGVGGAVWSTNDGGATWRHLNEPERFFAPWYYVALALLALFLYWIFPEVEPPVPESSISSHPVSDRALGPEDPDYLGTGELARGVSRFIRNDKTEPPLTIAVTGQWGSGKSSLLNLIYHDLKDHRFSPVRFNAWHHQNQEELLAALLENIRLQFVPPAFSFPNFVFRLRLLIRRSKRDRLRLLGVLFVLFASVGYVLSLPQESSQDFFATLANGFGEPAKPGPDSGSAEASAGLSRMPAGVLGKLGAFGGPLAILLSAIALVMRIFRSTATFRSSFRSVSAGLFNRMRVRDLNQDPGFHYRFAREFEDVTVALRKRTLVILIDDLDRCRAANVMHILEAVNFLVTSGKCVIIMGMAMRQVAGFVGLGFRDVAHELIEDSDLQQSVRRDDANLPEPDAEGRPPIAKESAPVERPPADSQPSGAADRSPDSKSDLEGDVNREKRREYALRYLEKLVNIEIPVPLATESQRKEMIDLKSRAPAAKPMSPWWRAALVAVGRIVRPSAPVIVWFLLFCGLGWAAYWGGGALGEYVKLNSDFGTDTSSDSPVQERITNREAPGRSSRRGRPVAGSNNETITKSPPVTSSIVVGAESAKVWSLYWLLLIFPMLGAYRWLFHSPSDIIHDSSDFKESLEIWNELIRAKLHTPRTIKRFQNRVRYYAMGLYTRKANVSRWQEFWNDVDGKPNGGTDVALETAVDISEMPEQVLVTLAALHEFDYRWIEVDRMWACVVKALNGAPDRFAGMLLSDYGADWKYREMVLQAIRGYQQFEWKVPVELGDHHRDRFLKIAIRSRFIA